MSKVKMIDYTTSSEEPRRCKEGILNEYSFYCEETECHEDFHYWMGLGLISACMGRRFGLDMGFDIMYPNMYIVLVGEAGLSGKSTAIGMATRIFKEAWPGNNPPLIAQKITPSALVGELGRLEGEGDSGASGFISSSEFSTLLGNCQKDDEILKILTDLWDSPGHFEYTTRGRGREELNNVCLNMIAGSTPSWLKMGIPESSLEGGFFSRLLLVNRPRGGKRIALPFLTMSPEHDEARSNIIHDLTRILLNRGGVFKLLPDAARLYTDWYEEQLDVELSTANLHMRGYYARKRTSILKIAMVISMSQNDSFEIDRASIHQALTLLENNEKHLGDLVDYLGSSKEGMDNEFIKSKLLSLWQGDKALRRGKYVAVTHSQLVRAVSHRYPLRQLVEITQLLEEAEFLTILPEGSSRLYRTTKRTNDIIRNKNL